MPDWPRITGMIILTMFVACRLCLSDCMSVCDCVFVACGYELVGGLSVGSWSQGGTHRHVLRSRKHARTHARLLIQVNGHAPGVITPGTETS